MPAPVRTWLVVARTAALIAGALAIAAAPPRLDDPEPAENQPRLLSRLGSSEGRHGHATSAHFPADGKTMVTAGWAELRLWDRATRKLLRRYSVEGANFGLISSTSDGRY